jgi:hypothetical protein
LHGSRRREPTALLDEVPGSGPSFHETACFDLGKSLADRTHGDASFHVKGSNRRQAITDTQIAAFDRGLELVGQALEEWVTRRWAARGAPCTSHLSN